MPTVSAFEGIVYGYKIMGYYIAVIIVGNIIAGIGGGAMASGFDVGLRADPNWGLVFFGLLLLFAGILTILAGLFGAAYKLIADGVAKGQMMASG